MSSDFFAKSCLCCDSLNLIKSQAIIMPFLAKRAFGWEPLEITEELGFRDIKPGWAYATCGSVLCSECEFLFQDYRYSDEQLDSIYKDYFSAEYIAQRDYYEPGFAKRAQFLFSIHQPILTKVEDFIKAHIKLPESILDWGGGTGSNTPFREECGKVDIYEISDEALLPGCKRVTPQAAAGTDYQLIVSRHVLEHVPNPQQVMRQMVSYLKPSAHLYFEVPHEKIVREIVEPEKRLHAKRHWHEHINFYSEKSVRSLFESVGLQIVDLKSIQTHESIWSFCCLGKLK